MALAIPDIFKKSIVSTNVFEMRDLNIKYTSGAPNDNFPLGTMVVNVKDLKLYTRVTAGAELPNILYFKLNEAAGTGVADISGNGHTGTATTGTWEAGKYDNGFNSENDEIEVQGHADFELPANFCVEFWIKWTAKDAGEDLIFSRTDGNAASAIVEGYFLETNGDSVTWHMHNGAAPTTTTIGTWSTLFKLGEWAHIAISRTGATVSFYVNGILQSTHANSRVVDGLAITDDLIIGAAPNKAFNTQAVFDEFKFWNTARTLTEIQRDIVTNDDLVWISTSLVY